MTIGHRTGMGAIPDWYPLLRAAKYLGVAPWELARQPAIWRTWAVMGENAEAKAQEQLAKLRHKHR